MGVPTLAFTRTPGPPDAPLLVLGPSLGTSTIVWERVVAAFADTYGIIAWDLPGHGASSAARGPFTVADLAEAVSEAIAESGAQRVFYAGVSLGGATGLELVLRHPGLVEGAVIVASGARIGEPEAWLERAAQVRAQSTSSVISASAQRWFAPGSIEREPDLAGRLLHALQDADDESYALCCEALAAYDVCDRLGEIATPVLALWGEHDGVAPQAKSVEIAEGVADGRVARIEGAGHLPPAERPETTARAIAEFIEDLNGRKAP